MMRSVRDLSDMGGRVALVTGGAGHIGTMTVDTLVELGAQVVVADLEVGAVPATDQVAGMAVDLEDEAAVRALPGRVVDRFGRLDVLVHTAALVGTTPLEGWGVPLADQSSDTWRRALEVNLTSAFVLLQESAPLMADGEVGSAILVSSIYGMLGPDMRLYEGTGMGNAAAYAASKGGLLQLVRWMATTLAPQVRVNAITPGGIARGQDPRFVDRYEERTPMGRMGTEEDLRGAVAYLASDLSAYVTGQNLVVDGGWTAW